MKNFALISTFLVVLCGANSGCSKGTSSSPASSPSTGVVGRFVYVTNAPGNNISMYTLNGTTGVLSATSPATISSGGNGPYGIVVDLHSKFAYTVNSGSANV